MKPIIKLWKLTLQCCHERTVFSINGLGQYPYENKINFDPYFIPYSEINLMRKHKPLEKIYEHLYDSGEGKDFLNIKY